MKNVVLLFLFFVCLNIFPQGVKVKEVKETVSGSDAFHAPMDENGHPCGLVKVLTTIGDLTFEGNVKGVVENKTNEYHVFLSRGSDMLIIKRSHILPLTIKFKDYGIDQIASKATYCIILKEEKMNATKNGVIVNVRPPQAKVRVDEILIENENGDGSYQLVLPKGDHVLKFEEKGYRPSVQVIKTGKGTQTLNIELESLLADLEISCKMSTAEIWIDDELKGTGAWQGRLPAGTYKITAKQKGFSSETKEITIEEKSSRSLVLPMLERAEGRVVVITDPQGSRVSIDGKGNYPSGQPFKVQTGQHTVIAKLPFGYKDGKKEIEVGEEGIDSVFIVIEPMNSTYALAFHGDVEKQLQLANECQEKAIYNDNDSIERNYWYDQVLANITKLDNSVFLSEYKSLQLHYGEADKELKVLLHRIKIGGKWDDFEKGSVFSDIANCYERLHNYQEAIKWRKQAVEIAGKGSLYLSYKNLAQAYEKACDKSQAVIWYKKAASEWDDINNRDSWGWATLELADAYLRLGYNKDAAEIYRHFIQKSPNDINVNEWKNKLQQTGY